jgi:hypothetical protein
MKTRCSFNPVFFAIRSWPDVTVRPFKFFPFVFVFLLLWPAFAEAQEAPSSLADLAAHIRDAGLDPEECYRIRDLDLTREDARLYLTDGFLIFGKPVNGRRVSAVFVGEIDGGDAEILLFPPARSERLSLAKFTESPNLSEHFRLAAFLFTDNTHAEVLARIAKGDVGRKVPEAGPLYAEKYSSVVRNLSESLELRLVKDVMNPVGEDGFFLASIRGERLGAFDFVLDYMARKGIRIGQFSVRDNKPYFDTWAHFEPRSISSGKRQPAQDDYLIEHYAIDATLSQDLTLSATTRLRLIPKSGRRTIGLLLSENMRVTGATALGQNLEIYRPSAMRLNSYRRDRDSAFLLQLPEGIRPGEALEVEIRHEGQVIQSAGNDVFAVGSRGSWYPGGALRFGTHELVFRLPSTLDFVATGDRAERTLEGDIAIHRVSVAEPVRTFGFNIGKYKSVQEERNGFAIHVHANKQVETALEPSTRVVVVPSSAPPSRRNPMGQQIATVSPSRPDPTRRLHDLAKEVGSLMEKLSARFGPPPLKVIHVSPIPGHFGQGYTGMIYLSTISYLPEADRPAYARQAMTTTFFSDLLLAHEVAHQWWGNSVYAESDQDEWLMEGLASYTALMMMEEQKGKRAVQDVLRAYRDNLIASQGDGRSVESAGPIIWGGRLSNSQDKNAWTTITYEKGAWIFHMLRARMGDEAFNRMLSELARKFYRKPISTAAFREFAVDFMPEKGEDHDLEEFFGQWVESTGIPQINLRTEVTGRPPRVKVTGSLEQSKVPDDFGALAPIHIRFPRGKSEIRWVRAANDGEDIDWTFSAIPTKIELDPEGQVLRRE